MRRLFAGLILLLFFVVEADAANRFWVGGTGTWDTSTTHWSTTTGGGSGASAPGSGDVAIFDASSGGGTVTRAAASVTLAGLTMSSAAAMTLAGTGAITVVGNVALGTNVTYSNTGNLSVNGTLTSNGKTLVCDVLSGGTITLADALVTTGDLILTAGGMNAANFNVTAAVVDIGGTTSRTVTMGSGTWTLTGTSFVWDVSATNLTLNKDTATIVASNSSATSRTISGGSVEVNNVSITAGTGTVTTTSMVVNNLVWTGFAGTWANSAITVKGNFTLSTGMTITAGTGTLTLGGTSGTQTITSNGKTFDRPVTINAAGATKQLADALVIGSTRAFTHTAGTFDANNLGVTTGTFASSNSNTRVITMGSGTWTIQGTGTAWNLATTTGLTLNANTSTIKFTDSSATARTFSGGSLTYNNFWHAPGAGTATLTIAGGNTFADFKDDGSATHQITFTNGTTNTFTTFTVSGNSGALISLRSNSGGAQFTLSKSSGSVTRDYLDIMDSVATGGATWTAGDNSINSGNNTGWIFPAPPVTVVPAFSLRSP